jgi:4-hydroxythreonine-4-phosphate dehydrogenase
MSGRKDLMIGITMGDPSGIGPEIILKSFENPSIRKRRIVVIGDHEVMDAAAVMLKTASFRIKAVRNMEECIFSREILNVMDLRLVRTDDIVPGKVSALSGNAAFQYIRKAVSLIQDRSIDTLVTAPINKEAIHLAGHNYPGHTEILASLTGTRDFAMLLHSKKLNVIHVSTHVSLGEAVRLVKRDRIEKVVTLAYDAMTKLCKGKPVIAVAGLNPHSGESGLFGDEEIKEIIPAVDNLKIKGMDVTGPVPPDSVFMQALSGKYDLVVAMYHDQGHIPLKLTGFSYGVNITVGLPFVRTSVDHGTAFEIAWQGKADEGSMTEAIKLAIRLAN